MTYFHTLTFKKPNGWSDEQFAPYVQKFAELKNHPELNIQKLDGPFLG